MALPLRACLVTLPQLSKMVDRDAAEKASRRVSQAKTPVMLSRTISGASTPRDGGSLTPRGAAAAAFGRPGVPRLLLPTAGSGQTTPRLSGALRCAALCCAVLCCAVLCWPACCVQTAAASSEAAHRTASST